MNIRLTPFSLKHKALVVLLGTAITLPQLGAVPELAWKSHDRDRPAPPVVDPAIPSTEDQVGTAPSDAVVLFDGSDLSQWAAMDGTPTEWVIKDGVLECVPDSGYIRTLRSFGDCQLHVEWATPKDVQGESQGRGNSGVFLGLNRYEIQVLDSYQSRSYSDGTAGSIYGQYPPAVNVSKAPGEWQTYDIIYTAPRFSEHGVLISYARLTVIHNGVLIQNNEMLTGPTAWIGRPPYDAHPVKQPIALQDHGNPVRYRNIWVRELGDAGKPEYLLPDSLLDQYVGTYKKGWGDPVVIERMDHGLLKMKMAGAELTLYAESATEFFAKTTDVLCRFDFEGEEDILMVSVGDGWMRMPRME